MSKSVKLFIVEGEKRECRFVEEMAKSFFKDTVKTKIVQIPAHQNLYMLYKILKADDFDTDIVELLRDNFEDIRLLLSDIDRQSVDEVFMFFDYDIHQNNLGHDCYETPDEILNNMLDVFNDETDHGKLYINYPMVEALYDYIDEDCKPYSKCLIDLDSIPDYKGIAGNPTNTNASKRLSFTEWEAILAVFYLRICCLFGIEKITFKEYNAFVSPLSIYHKENKCVNKNKSVFVLSAFPEFIFDYFKVDFWNSKTRYRNRNINKCFLASKCIVDL